MRRLLRLFGGAPPRSAAPAATDADVRMMRLALQTAEQAVNRGEVPVGAVLYETATERVLSIAHNRREMDHDPAAHAELLVMRDGAKKLGDWRLNNCTLVVTLEPCVMCAGLIVNARLGRLVYGATDPKAGAVGSLYHICQDTRLNHRITPIGGVLAEECGALLRDFFRARRGRRGGEA